MISPSPVQESPASLRPTGQRERGESSGSSRQFPALSGVGTTHSPRGHYSGRAFLLTKPMKPEIAKLWVAALRSGKYKQGRGRLRRGDSFCCLGVLCDLSKLSEWKSGGYYGSADEARAMHPPVSVLEWAGLRSESGKFGRRHYLSNMNDERFTFAAIADTIEANVEKL